MTQETEDQHSEDQRESLVPLVCQVKETLSSKSPNLRENVSDWIWFQTDWNGGLYGRETKTEVDQAVCDWTVRYKAKSFRCENCFHYSFPRNGNMQYTVEVL